MRLILIYCLIQTVPRIYVRNVIVKVNAPHRLVNIPKLT